MSEKRGFPRQLRRNFRVLLTSFQRGRLQYPRTADALRRLQDAIEAEIPADRGSSAARWRKRKGPATDGTTSGASRKHYRNMLRLKADNA